MGGRRVRGDRDRQPGADQRHRPVSAHRSLVQQLQAFCEARSRQQERVPAVGDLARKADRIGAERGEVDGDVPARLDGHPERSLPVRQ